METSAVDSKVVHWSNSKAEPKDAKKVVVHGPSARPAEPPAGMIYSDSSTGYKERWDGQEWVPLKKNKNGV